MEYSIKGMTCGACKKLIDMDLEDANFADCSVDEKTHTITIPQSYKQDIEKIRAIVNATGDYEMLDQ